MTDQALQRRVDRLLAESDFSEVLAIRNAVREHKRKATELDRLLRDRMVEWIDTFGEQETPEGRHYVGTTRTYKPARSPNQVLIFLVAATDGDLDAVAELMVSSPFKPGAVRELIGQEAFDGLFATQERLEPRTGKPRREVKTVPVLRRASR